MLVTVSPQEIWLTPGSVLRIPANWELYCDLAELLKDRSIPRLKYRPGEVLLMSPLPQHGRKIDLVVDAIKVMLDFLGVVYQSFAPITINLPEVGGIEPDYCFYIDNYQAAIGRDRIDWESDPPPDLAIEIDVTSYTDIADYIPFRIPEVWLIKGEELTINQYQEDRGVYIDVESSKYFPGIDIKDAIAYCFALALEMPSSLVMQEFKKFLNVSKH